MKLRHAFSLVELAIVLVILGLLVGGILAGQSLIHAAELRKVTRDLTNYRTAIWAFRDKYFAWPGDMVNATSFWPSGAANGDGDGKVGSSPNNATSSGENLRFWQHLQQAGLIEGGQYTGRNATAAPWLVPGVNLPRLMGNAALNITAYNTDWNMFQIGSTQSDLVNTNFLWGSSFNGEDSWNMDTKLDDGAPLSGKITGANGSVSSNGVGVTCISSSAYALGGGNSTGCLLRYRALD